VLVDSFNRMTAQLEASRHQLETSRAELQVANGGKEEPDAVCGASTGSGRGP
jgi:hypothetical protein